MTRPGKNAAQTAAEFDLTDETFPKAGRNGRTISDVIVRAVQAAHDNPGKRVSYRGDGTMSLDAATAAARDMRRVATQHGWGCSPRIVSSEGVAFTENSALHRATAAHSAPYRVSVAITDEKRRYVSA